MTMGGKGDKKGIFLDGKGGQTRSVGGTCWACGREAEP